MLKNILLKELRLIILSPKFVATFGTLSLLILLSVFVGIQEYKAVQGQYYTAKNITEQEMSQSNSWMGMRNKAYRLPDPMQIFISGVNNDIGRFSNISNWISLKLQNSIYSDDPIFAVFRFLDFSFLVLVVLSLFAIIFTYDSINGERESGTLKLVFSNPVPRAKFILAKLIGSSLGLIIPLLVPVLLSMLLILLYNIPFTMDHWLRFFTFLFISFLYFIFFITFGILISAMTKKSSTSFLFLLVFWVVFVFIIPRVSIMISGQIIKVPTIAETESQIDNFSRELWNKHYESISKTWAQRSEEMKNMSDEERKAYRDQKEWQWMQEDDKLRKEIEKQISDYSTKVREDLRNKHTLQEKIAFLITRFSPSSSFQLASMNIASTDIFLKNRYEDAINDYKTQFIDFTQKKQKESGNSGMFRISMDSKTGIQISDGRKESSLDLSELPRFKDPKVSFSEMFSSTLIDIFLLSLFILIAFVGSFFAFLRYDMR